jgi:hypothetical protein
MSQKTELLITTAVRTPDSTYVYFVGIYAEIGYGRR